MIVNRQRAVTLSTGALEKFLRQLRQELRLGDAEVTVCLVSDAEIAGMNELFRKRIGPTDVLSFPAGQRQKTPPSTEPRIPGHTRMRLRIPLEVASGGALGDIAIAPAVAKRNAKSYGRTLPTELKILMLHGVLHLLGYDHETDRGEMYRVERRLRKRMGLA
ncbi:MAG: rRNA maturation RNase YbeY [Candidatus Acidiferrum sp.]